MAERSNAADCKSVDGVPPIQGVESLSRRQIETKPTDSANCLWGLTSDPRPKAGLVPSVILSPSSEESKAQSDLPQLPIECRKAGRRPDGVQRFRCAQCSETFSEPKDFGVFGHKQVDEARTLQALHMICE